MMREEIYKEGRRAYDEKPQCPYKLLSEEWRAWMKGYMEAMQDSRDKK